MDENQRSYLKACLYRSILIISCPPNIHYPEPCFTLTPNIIDQCLALLDPKDFLSQALRYYQNYLEHKELRKHEVELHVEINTRLDDDLNAFLIKHKMLRHTAGNWLEELIGTSGEQALESPSTDGHGSDKQLTTDIEMATEMEIDSPESETYQTSFVEMPSDGGSKPWNPTLTVRKRRLDDEYDTDESLRQGSKRLRVLW